MTKPPVKFLLPSLYAITDPSYGKSHLEQVNSLIHGGVKMIQVRDKSGGSRHLETQCSECVVSARQAGVILIVNDRVDVAIASGADGVHLGQGDLGASEARRLLGAEAIIGLSTHSVEQARSAIEEPVDYIAIGPIFTTATKTGTGPTVGLEGIRAVRDAIGDFPLVAIGGINLTNVVEVLNAGADSVAVISDLHHAGGIRERLSQYLVTIETAGLKQR